MNGRDAPLCDSGKRGYNDRAAAMGAIRRIKADPRLRTGKVPAATYECRLCGRWHLTSRKGKGDRH